MASRIGTEPPTEWPYARKGIPRSTVPFAVSHFVPEWAACKAATTAWVSLQLKLLAQARPSEENGFLVSRSKGEEFWLVH